MLYICYVYELVSFVVRGKVRKKVLALLVKPSTPTEVSRTIHTHRSTVSRTILALEKKGLVECITPKEKMGRYYRITKKGQKVLGEM
jgi:DNA-binding MarR family transcriptional regulator